MKQSSIDKINRAYMDLAGINEMDATLHSNPADLARLANLAAAAKTTTMLPEIKGGMLSALFDKSVDWVDPDELELTAQLKQPWRHGVVVMPSRKIGSPRIYINPNDPAALTGPMRYGTTQESVYAHELGHRLNDKHLMGYPAQELDRLRTEIPALDKLLQKYVEKSQYARGSDEVFPELFAMHAVEPEAMHPELKSLLMDLIRTAK